MGNSDSKAKQMYEYYFDPLTGEFRDAAIDKMFDNNNFINQLHSHIKEKTENKYAGASVERSHNTLKTAVTKLKEDLSENYTRVEDQDFYSKTEVNSLIEDKTCKAYCIKDGSGDAIGVNDFFTSDSSNNFKDTLKEHMNSKLKEEMTTYKADINKTIRENKDEFQEKFSEFEDNWNGDEWTENVITSITNRINTETRKNLIPKGTIVAFEEVLIPEGWVVCDGKNKTPDLRHKFIVGETAESFELKKVEKLIREAYVVSGSMGAKETESTTTAPTTTPVDILKALGKGFGIKEKTPQQSSQQSDTPTTQLTPKENNDILSKILGNDKDPTSYKMKFIMKT
jgi:hypothetical protein